MCAKGCPKRLRNAAIATGWVQHEDGWWRHPTNGEPPFQESDVDRYHKEIVAVRPSLWVAAAKEVASDSLKAAKAKARLLYGDTIARLGLTPHNEENTLTQEEKENG